MGVHVFVLTVTYTMFLQHLPFGACLTVTRIDWVILALLVGVKRRLIVDLTRWPSLPTITYLVRFRLADKIGRVALLIIYCSDIHA